MAINVSVRYNGGLLPDIILLTQCHYHRGTRLNAMKQPIMRIEDRLFDGGWVRSAMATRRSAEIFTSGNILWPSGSSQIFLYFC